MQLSCTVGRTWFNGEKNIMSISLTARYVQNSIKRKLHPELKIAIFVVLNTICNWTKNWSYNTINHPFSYCLLNGFLKVTRSNDEILKQISTALCGPLTNFSMSNKIRIKVKFSLYNSSSIAIENSFILEKPFVFMALE